MLHTSICNFSCLPCLHCVLHNRPKTWVSQVCLHLQLASSVCESQSMYAWSDLSYHWDQPSGHHCCSSEATCGLISSFCVLYTCGFGVNLLAIHQWRTRLSLVFIRVRKITAGCKDHGIQCVQHVWMSWLNSWCQKPAPGNESCHQRDILSSAITKDFWWCIHIRSTSQSSDTEQYLPLTDNAPDYA